MPVSELCMQLKLIVRGGIFRSVSDNTGNAPGGDQALWLPFASLQHVANLDELVEKGQVSDSNCQMKYINDKSCVLLCMMDVGQHLPKNFFAISLPLKQMQEMNITKTCQQVTNLAK